MKRSFILFWHGLKGILAGIANWFAVFLGMKDDSKYCKIVRRIVSTSFAVIMVMVAAVAILATCRIFYDEVEYHKMRSEDSYDSQYVSWNVTYYSKGYDSDDGYIKTADGEKTLQNISWIGKPWGGDSLVCYSDGKMCGYFNMFTGRTVIKPQYSNAWIFSEGLAAVDDGGLVKFIDKTGKIVLETEIPYQEGVGGYIFQNGYCIVHDSCSGLVGLIDKTGKWKLEPEYTSIVPHDSLWLVESDKKHSVLSSDLRTIIPYVEGKFYFLDGVIDITLSDHTLCRYDTNGNLIEDFFIRGMEYLTYETPELHYTIKDSEVVKCNVLNDTEEYELSHELKTAKCMVYEAAKGWYGLITTEGKIVTPPSYSNITAVGYDLYFCEDFYEDGVLLNGRGERIKLN